MVPPGPAGRVVVQDLFSERDVVSLSLDAALSSGVAQEEPCLDDAHPAEARMFVSHALPLLEGARASESVEAALTALDGRLAACPPASGRARLGVRVASGSVVRLRVLDSDLPEETLRCVRDVVGRRCLGHALHGSALIDLRFARHVETSMEATAGLSK